MIMNEWVSNVNLKKHAWAVEAALRAYASRYGEDPERLYFGEFSLRPFTGRDFNYERHTLICNGPSPFQGA